MNPFRTLAAALAVALLPTLALAHEGIHMTDPYARFSGAAAKSAAVFFVIENHGPNPDTLLSATTDAAERAELHTHVENANGVMSMVEIEDGITVPGMTNHALDRGGDHVMLVGLTRPLAQGDTIELVLTFEREGEVRVTVPVDNDRAPGAATMGHDHAAPSQ